MAICYENGQKAFNFSKLHVEAVQTVVPTKPTDPKHSRKRLNIFDPFGSGLFQRRFQVVMFYNKASDDGDNGSGFVMAGWFKESLSLALAEEPIFASRLRRTEDGDHGDSFEIVSNDSGARLIEASIPMELAEFAGLKENKAEPETQLVFWENINEQNPQFFPLFYVQVTNFKCGGFSIGISCSLLVADPLSMINFLKIWSDIHNNIVSGSDSPKTPLFYLFNLKPTGRSSPSLLNIDPQAHSKASQSLIFKFAGKIANWDDDQMYKNLSELCILEAAKMLGGKTDSNFSLILKDTSGNLKVEKGSMETVDKKLIFDKFHDFVFADWDDLEVCKVCFNGVVKPSDVSCWISSVSGEWLVMVVQDGSGINIVVTLPS